ncbi:hypothetical protein BpHYR1_051857 [Brachionus plicatilis]|uniref:Uncharacterized protein n=1 Tax=Brachionus plicatilis TaxID=10195 RepID=A0A3M7SHY4_BRAPC|nr:hypothetical protein BpHYR1_051857 [Brachionus plicatilis]
MSAQVKYFYRFFPIFTKGGFIKSSYCNVFEFGWQTYPTSTFPTKSFNQDNTFIGFKTTKGKLCIGYLTEKYRFKYESKIIGYKS